MPAKGSGRDRQERIFPLCNGQRTSAEIAAILGDSAKYVQRVMKKFDLPRLPQAPRTGEHNPSFCSGRRIDRDGYVMVSAPLGHPYARRRESRSYGVMFEHRLVMERKLGRYLDPTEVVDHIDELRLHNCPSNLRLFGSNADHLHETIAGKVPKWSREGLHALALRRCHQHTPDQRVHKYLDMKRAGDARLRQILLAALQFGIDSPFLLGSHHHLAKVGIVDFSDSSLKRALADLSQRYA